MKLFGTAKLVAGLLVSSLFVTGSLAADAKCGACKFGGDKNSTKDMKKADAKCGAGKCGGEKKEMKKPADGKCGGEKK